MRPCDLACAARLALVVFVGCCTANAFFWWSVPAWLSLFGEPAGLVSPGVDRWLITPMAMAIYLLQYPSYWVARHSPWEAHGPIWAGVIAESLVSTALYAPILVAVIRWRQKRGARAAERGGAA
jgi:hypothetical protein